MDFIFALDFVSSLYKIISKASIKIQLLEILNKDYKV